MFDQIDLRELAEMTAAERAFLTVYLSGPQALKALDKRLQQAEALVRDHRDEAEHLAENVKRLRDWLENNPPKTGLALFVCWALDFLLAVPLDAPVRDEVIVDSSPYIRPLAELQDEYETFAVVAADNKRTAIYLVTAATAEAPEQVKGNIKNHVRKGGWSQQRYERRRDKQLLHYAKEIAERLAELDRSEPFDRIVMVGSKETLGEIRNVLPAHLARQVIGEQSLDLKADRDSIDEQIFELFFAAEREAEKQLWERIRGEHLRGGLGAVGAADVLAAAQAGRVEKMVVARNLQIEGVRCRECETLSLGKPDVCPKCGADSLFAVGVVNEIVELLARTGAEADFVDPLPGLSEVGGIAALLRY